MRGRLASNAANNSLSDRRFSSEISSKVTNRARSARSGRVMMSPMPFRMIGRAASNSTSSLLVHSERTEKPPPLDSRHSVSRQPRRQSRHVVEDEQVSVGGGYEELAIVARQGAQRRGVGIDERPQDFRHGRLGGALFAGEGERRIRAMIDERGQRPGDDQDEIAIGANVEKGPEVVDRSAALRSRQFERARRATKPHRRSVDDPPAARRRSRPRRHAESQRSR